MKEECKDFVGWVFFLIYLFVLFSGFGIFVLAWFLEVLDFLFPQMGYFW